MEGVIEEVQIAHLFVDRSGLRGDIGRQVGSGGSEPFGAVGAGVTVAGGLDHRRGPVAVEVLAELLDAADAPLVVGVEVFPPGLCRCQLVSFDERVGQVLAGPLQVGCHRVDVSGGVAVLPAAAGGEAAPAGSRGMLFAPMSQAVLPVGEVLLPAGDGGVRLGDAVGEVGGTLMQVGSVVVLFGLDVLVGAIGVVVGGEGFGLGAGQGGGDLLGGGGVGSWTMRPPWSPSSRRRRVVFQVWVGATERDWPT